MRDDRQSRKNARAEVSNRKSSVLQNVHAKNGLVVRLRGGCIFDVVCRLLKVDKYNFGQIKNFNYLTSLSFVRYSECIVVI